MFRSCERESLEHCLVKKRVVCASLQCGVVCGVGFEMDPMGFVVRGKHCQVDSLAGAALL